MTEQEKFSKNEEIAAPEIRKTVDTKLQKENLVRKITNEEMDTKPERIKELVELRAKLKDDEKVEVYHGTGHDTKLETVRGMIGSEQHGITQTNRSATFGIYPVPGFFDKFGYVFQVPRGEIAFPNDKPTGKKFSCVENGVLTMTGHETENKTLSLSFLDYDTTLAAGPETNLDTIVTVNKQPRAEKIVDSLGNEKEVEEMYPKSSSERQITIRELIAEENQWLSEVRKEVAPVKAEVRSSVVNLSAILKEAGGFGKDKIDIGTRSSFVDIKKLLEDPEIQTKDPKMDSIKENLSKSKEFLSDQELKTKAILSEAEQYSLSLPESRKLLENQRSSFIEKYKSLQQEISNFFTDKSQNNVLEKISDQLTQKNNKDLTGLEKQLDDLIDESHGLNFISLSQTGALEGFRLDPKSPEDKLKNFAENGTALVNQLATERDSELEKIDSLERDNTNVLMNSKIKLQRCTHAIDAVSKLEESLQNLQSKVAQIEKDSARLVFGISREKQFQQN